MARALALTPCQLAEMQSQAEVESPTIYRKSYGDPLIECSGEVRVRVMESGGSYAIDLSLWVGPFRGTKSNEADITNQVVTNLGLEVQSCAQLPAWLFQFLMVWGGTQP